MTQSQMKNSIETTSYKMSLKKPSTSNDSTTSSDSDDASDSSSNSSSSTNSEASVGQKSQPATKFSILKNDTDSGLRMKIAAIPKSPYKKSNNTSAETSKPAAQKSKNNNRTTTDHRKESNENMNNRKAAKSTMSNMKKRRNDSTSNSSCCSACTESDDDSDSSSFCSKEKRVSKTIKQLANGKTEKVNNSTIRRSAGTSRTIRRKKQQSESSDSDSDSSDESSDSEPTEKRSSPIKPQQKFKNDLLKTVPGVSSQNLTADGASSSDMELPALVRAAIQCVESGSEGENNTKIESVSKTQYTSSLLRDFVTKSQMMGSNVTNSNNTLTNKNDSKSAMDEKALNQNSKKADTKQEKSTIDKSKKKRGRPRRQATTNDDATQTNNSSGSPDSGIISTPQSPVPSTNHANSSTSKPSKKTSTAAAKKFDLAAFEKNMYATERVLYPPRRKKQSNHHDSLENLSRSTSERTEKVDPVWKKIDINKKFRRPSECGYRSDTNTICSKVLAAQSGYTTDYANINRRILSGYKSDYSCKSRRSGYKSDCSFKAKSCGYRSDCSTKHRRRIRRKRRTKTMLTKPTFNDQDILMLAGLSLGHSDESSLDSSDKPTPASTKSSSNTSKNRNQNAKTSNLISSLISSSSHGNGSASGTGNRKITTLAKISSNKSFGRDASTTLSERVAKRLNSMNFDSLTPSMSGSPYLTITSSIYKDGGDANLLKLDGIKAGLIRRRRSSAVSHCSSHCSTNSRHPFRRRRRRRLKSTCDQMSETNLAKLNLQVDLLADALTSCCKIFTEKPATREKAATTNKSSSSKRTNKKRKTNQETNETAAIGTNATTKRRNKKTVQTKSPDDHKLPLKKRHYLMTPGEQPSNKKGTTEETLADDKSQNEQTSADNEIEIVGKAITPKKRHLLQTPVDLNDVVDSTDATSNSTCKDLQEIQASVSISITNDNSAASKTASQSKKSEATRKKNRLEGLVSKISPSSAQSVAKESATKPVAVTSSKSSSTPKSSNASKTPSIKSGSTAKSLSTKSAPKASPTPKTVPAAKSTQSTFLQIYENSSAKTTSPRSVNDHRNKIDLNPPPGVFEPSIDLELQIPFSEIPIPLSQKPTDIAADSSKTINSNQSKAAAKTSETKKAATTERVVEKLLNRTGIAQTGGVVKKKRKKPNRTGFPTLKKRKKPATKPQSPKPSEEMITEPIANHISAECEESKQNCDRVPSDGETAGTFIERNSKPRLSVISIERLQAKGKSNANANAHEEKISSRKKSKNDKNSQKNNKRVENSTNIDKSDGISKKSKSDSKAITTTTNSEINSKEQTVNNTRTVNKSSRSTSKEVDKDRKKTQADSVSLKHAQNAIEASGTITRRSRSTTTTTTTKAQSEHLNNSSPERQPIPAQTAKSHTTADKKSRSTSSVRLTPVLTTSQSSDDILERSRSKVKKIGAETTDAGGSNIDKKQRTSSDVKKSTEIKSGQKRTVNGQILSASSNSEKSVTNSVKMAGEELQKNGKKVRRDQTNEVKSTTTTTTTNDKKKSNKREADPVAHEKKRPRLNSNASSKSSRSNKSPTKKGNSLNEKPIIEETVTDLSEIVSVDDWIDPMHEDPLPLEENVNNIETLTDLIPLSDVTRKTQSRPKKKYLVAGLFSNYYKEDHALASHGDKTVKSASEKKQSNVLSEDSYTGSLLPMPFYAKHILHTQIDFCLPWDLWYAHENNKLTGRNIVHSWNFKKIRLNVYADSVKPINQSAEMQQCSCKPEYECGDNCLNRLVYTECEPETCPCGDKCRNTKIQRHIVAPTERFMTPNKGWGVKTNNVIKKGTYILEYVGEVVTEREFKERMATLYTNDIHHYCLHLDGGLVIDGHRMGSDCRFVNHSCEPNCEMQKWSVNGLCRMALFAMRDIRPGEELTYDYNFSLFNPADGQVCKCESQHCRGVIGGKSQRVRAIESKNPEKVNDAKKGKANRPKRGGQSKSKVFMHSKDHLRRSLIQMPSIKEQILIADGHCFLLRNLRKMRTASQKPVPAAQPNQSSLQTSLAAKISALRVPRNIRTRGVAIAEHDPVVEKTVRIAGVLREICEELNSFKDASGQYAITKLSLPSRKKVPQYYEKIKNPIDLSTIEANVEKGAYENPTLFDEDVNRLFSNAIEYFGNESPEATITMQLQTVYARKKSDLFDRLVAICGESTELNKLLETQSGPFLCPVEDPNEDHIRCICGIFRDEGLMIQCSKCKIWQHTECTDADVDAEHYLCEKCNPRDIDYEIKLKDKTEEGYDYYLSLMRGNDLQIRQSDTVYVLRDIPIDENDGPVDTDKTKIRKHTYETIGEIDYNECDIFRVERMWKDRNGKRFIYGHHYLRPHETFHEPSRKFFKNEVIRVPLFEVVPIELIMGRCWVMDLNTFCKGRPVDSVESHVYICELRVDKAARLFSKISKNPYPVCTKSYAFKKFRQRLKISRSYLPHDVDHTAPKPSVNNKKRRNPEEISNQLMKKSTIPIVQLIPPPQKTLNEKRNRLETYLSSLMTKQRALNEDVQPLDLSYLLTGRGARRRTIVTNVPHKI